LERNQQENFKQPDRDFTPASQDIAPGVLYMVHEIKGQGREQVGNRIHKMRNLLLGALC
jgi:hypothetical protein